MEGLLRFLKKRIKNLPFEEQKELRKGKHASNKIFKKD